MLREIAGLSIVHTHG